MNEDFPLLIAVLFVVGSLAPTMACVINLHGYRMAHPVSKLIRLVLCSLVWIFYLGIFGLVLGII